MRRALVCVLVVLTAGVVGWAPSAQAVTGDTWTARNAAAPNQWTSVTYGNGLFVAVSKDGTNRVMTSPDGITWTPRASAPESEWSSVTFGNGLFVAVSRGPGGGVLDRVMTSPDGITWTGRDAAIDYSWSSVTFGNGLFVAVSSAPIDTTDARVMTSPDGIAWTSQDSAAGTETSVWSSVTFGAGLFVAVSSDPDGTDDRVMTSPNGIDWTVQATSKDREWTSVTFGNGLFVAVSSAPIAATDDRVMTSPDGIDWTFQDSAAGTAASVWTSVTFGAGLFVAVSSGPSGTANRVMTSPNGTAWTAIALAPNSAWTGVTYRGNLFVAVASTGTNRVMTSGTFVAAPSITSFAPNFGLVGSTVVITGTNLAGATVVAFDGVVATEFTIDDPTQITAKVPTGATTGPISVTTPGGTATSAGNFTVASSDRIFGPDAIDTSIAISEAEYPDDGTASSVVLARSDFFPDALAGGPLAARVNGPLLITPGAPITSVLDPRVLAEINRLLDPGATVHVLGGPLALSNDIDATLTIAGYGVERVYGANQFSTAVAIANQLGAPGAIFEATGWNFPDALSAVPAAIKLDGVIVLTNNNVQAPETQAYITAHPSVPRFAIGGPLVAGGADPGAVAVYGQNQYGTSAAVATKWFTDALLYGVATGANFPDALSGGVFMATGGRMGPVVLVPPALPLPTSTVTYLASLDDGTPGYAFGGPIAITDAVLAAVKAAVG